MPDFSLALEFHDVRNRDTEMTPSAQSDFVGIRKCSSLDPFLDRPFGNSPLCRQLGDGVVILDWFVLFGHDTHNNGLERLCQPHDGMNMG